MHLLILSANTGEGHNSAAKAIQEYFEARGDRCTVQDGLAFMPKVKNQLICRGHVFLYRKLPKVFGIGYRLEEFQHQHQPYQKKLIRQVSRRRHTPHSIPRFSEYVETMGFDAIICVHVFTARMISKMRRAGVLKLPCFFLATDYTCSPGVNQLDMDGWFLPHRSLVEEFSSYGIPEDRLIPAGIPVRNAFLQRPDMLDARRELGLPEDKRIAVLSCGSMGAGSMGKLVMLLSKQLDDDAMLIAICGNNHKLERRIKRIAHSKKLKVKGFVKQLNRYMDAADLFLTKPGGLSTTEAVHKGLPLLLINMVPGCETRNLQFLTSIGCAASAGGTRATARLAASMLQNPDALEAHARRCREEFADDPRKIIYDTIQNSMHS